MIRMNAYAKINLALDVVGVRDDGYHLLDMVMQEISLCDEITLAPADRVTVSSRSPLPVDNTLARACGGFFSFTGCRGGADIQIKKRIPVEAGLGGGSSDAAAVIRALDTLYDTRLTTAQMEKIALGVGADAPFFIRGGCAHVRGIGELIEPAQNRMEVFYLIAKPVQGVKTAKAFRLYDDIGGEHCKLDAVLSAIECGNVEAYRKSAANALKRAASRLCPKISAVMGMLRNAEARMVTGSGSCVFGLYRDEMAALNDAEFVSGAGHYARVCSAVSR